MIFITQLDASVITSNPAADDSIRESLIITSVEFSEMPRYLSAADVGLLLRKPHDTFRMATPIKLAEYLGAGLAVVVSEGIGDAARTVESRKIGVGIPADACEEAIEASARRLVSMVEGGVERVRQAALETCRELFLWERYVPFIARAYGCDIDGFHPGLEYEELQRASSEETFGRN
jgi:glycosyltransferase involved in cell wall biosynthesis